jgi:hypothetical protein
VFQLVLKTLKHLSFSRDQMQFEIDMIFQIEKISSGENIIISRGSSGFSKNFIFEISYSKYSPPKTIPVLVEYGDQIKDKINGEMFMDLMRAISIIAISRYFGHK